MADYGQGSAYFNERTAPWGVVLDAEDDLDALLPALPHLSLIVFEFAKFTDGRGYSVGRLLRQRYGFEGELRAVGDITRDQLMYLERCGFTAFQLKEGKCLDDAVAAFNELPTKYQVATDDVMPIWHRRLPA